MFTNIKNRFISVIAPDLPPLPSSSSTHNNHPHHSRGGRDSSHGGGGGGRQFLKQDKFQYARPPFLQLITQDELKASADHNVRPIIVPRDISLLPWYAGYAECVNSGKSEWNEDQAAFCKQVLSDPLHRHPDLPYTYFGVFDGHAGYGAALAASHQFHHILHEKLVDCIDMLLPRDDVEALNNSKLINGFPHPSHFYRRVSKDELIIGALESAFFHMDSLIAQDRDRYRDAGGCTACVALFINGKVYVANAGDSRAVLCQRKRPEATSNKELEKSKEKGTENDGNEEKRATTNDTNDVQGTFPVIFSFDHTPETERHRLLNVARLRPNLLGRHYAAMEYAKRPHERDLGQRILCRQGTMKGWTYKTLTREDLRMPVVSGEGKRSRLLGTLGVTRGFGDHDLLAINTGTQIKPFLTPHPDVVHRDLTKIVSIPDENNEDGDYGVLVMATDGLWDVSENENVARTVFQTLEKYPTERHRYTMAAQELVAKARGKINDSGHWRLADSKAAATVDDISVIVIPVYQYYKEYVEWEKRCTAELTERLSQQAQEAKETEVMLNGLNILVSDDFKEAIATKPTTSSLGDSQNPNTSATPSSPLEGEATKEDILASNNNNENDTGNAGMEGIHGNDDEPDDEMFLSINAKDVISSEDEIHSVNKASESEDISKAAETDLPVGLEAVQLEQKDKETPEKKPNPKKGNRNQHRKEKH